MGGETLYDMHCHLGWFADPAHAAQEASELGVGLLAVTVDPGEFSRLRVLLAGEKDVRVAAGLHPWWVSGATDADALMELLPQTRWVGEIGLDAAPSHAATYAAQLVAFERVCAACAASSDPAAPKVLSIHAVRSTTDALDALERTGAAERCRCVLHWFSGSPEELWRAVRLGCRFSLGERALATRRGREYARVLPDDALLTETDLPPEEGSALAVADVAASLERTVAAIAAARHADPGLTRVLLARNADALLGRAPR